MEIQEQMKIQEHLTRELIIGELVARNARKYPNKLALKAGEHSLTYSQWNLRVNKLANAFSEIGIRHGDKVAFLLYNGIEILDCYFALAKLGAVSVPINFRLVGPEIVYVVNNSDSISLVFGQSFENVIDSVKDQMFQLKHFIAVPGPTELSYALDFNELLSGGSDEEPYIMVSDNEAAAILYTAGTTGKPKGAVLTHKNLVSNILWSLIERHSYPDEICLVTAPLFHGAALSGGVLRTVFTGGSVIIHRKFDPIAVLETIEKERVTQVFMVPAMWNALLQVPNLGNYDVSFIKVAVTGGAIMPLSLKEAILKWMPNPKFYDSFGQTEMGLATIVLKPEDRLRKADSVGKPFMAVEVRVVDSEGNDVPVGQVGEIIYRSPSMFIGYYKNPDATREAMVDGWFHSGDLVRMDEDGFVYVVDRKNDMIISGGENVYPAEVEGVLHNYEKILEAAVIGIPSAKWGESVHAVVCPKPGETITPEEVIDYCAANMAGYKKPRSVAIIESLPRNAAGKVLKTRLREIYGKPTQSCAPASKDIT